jgi:hypothetical protein
MTNVGPFKISNALIVILKHRQQTLISDPFATHHAPLPTGYRLHLRPAAHAALHASLVTVPLPTTASLALTPYTLTIEQMAQPVLKLVGMAFYITAAMYPVTNAMTETSRMVMAVLLSAR